MFTYFHLSLLNVHFQTAEFSNQRGQHAIHRPPCNVRTPQHLMSPGRIWKGAKRSAYFHPWTSAMRAHITKLSGSHWWFLLWGTVTEAGTDVNTWLDKHSAALIASWRFKVRLTKVVGLVITFIYYVPNHVLLTQQMPLSLQQFLCQRLIKVSMVM